MTNIALSISDNDHDDDDLMRFNINYRFTNTLNIIVNRHSEVVPTMALVCIN